MSKNKVLTMEFIWLIIAIVTLVVFSISTIKNGFAESYILLIMSAVSYLMHLWRKNLRKKE